MNRPDNDLLPSIAHLLKRVGALERAAGVDVLAVARLPVFQSQGWRRSIAQFLRWSGTTLDAGSGASVFELMLCHGPAGARAIFEAYRHCLLETGGSFAAADAELEALRVVVSMAARWVNVIGWDLQEAPRLSAEEFRSRSEWGRRPAPAGPERQEGVKDVDRRLSEIVQEVRRQDADRAPGAGDPAAPGIWRGATGAAAKPPRRRGPEA